MSPALSLTSNFERSLTTRPTILTCRARAAFSIGNSDLLTDANAFAQWARMRSERRPNGEIRQFCEQVSPVVPHSCDALEKL